MDTPAHSGAADNSNSYKFLVRSAEEAVRVIRERLGEHAQVTSVRRVERAGLTGLFRGAQLEVIARVPTPGGAAPSAANLASPESASPSFAAHLENAAAHAPIVPWNEDDNAPIPAPSPVGGYALPSAGMPHLPPPGLAFPPVPSSSFAEGAGPSARPGGMGATLLLPDTEEEKLVRLLRRGGLTDHLLMRLQAGTEWERIARLTLPSALAEVAQLLRREYAAIPRPPLGNRVAFLGVAGAGGTSALCKHLARRIFHDGKRAAVFRLETDRPNSVDALAAICELWGAPLLRTEEELRAVPADTLLYVDVPGLGAAGLGEEENLAARLDELGVGSRVFALNAAYEPALLKELYRRALPLGCRHAAFTHLDELVHWGKLWEFLLHRDLAPIFYSTGPGVPGDCSEDILELALGKTFS